MANILYGQLASPHLKIYKPWLDPQFVQELGGRKEMSQWLQAHGFTYRTTIEKAYAAPGSCPLSFQEPWGHQKMTPNGAAASSFANDHH
jgi:hypothetical protein